MKNKEYELIPPINAEFKPIDYKYFFNTIVNGFTIGYFEI